MSDSSMDYLLDNLTEQTLDAEMEHKMDNLNEGKLDSATVQQTDY